MHLEEPAGGSEGLGRKGHGGYEAAVAACLAVGTAGALHAVGTVHDDGGHNLEHVGDVAEIDYEVVVAERVAALGEPDVGGSGLARLLYGVAHVGAAQKLGFLDVDGLARAGGRHEQVGLPAEEGRYLQHIDHLSGGLGLPAFVYVGQQA